LAYKFICPLCRSLIASCADECLPRSGGLRARADVRNVGQIAERCALDRKHVAGGGPCDLPAWKHHRVDGGAAIPPANHVWRAGIKPSEQGNGPLRGGWSRHIP